MQGAMRILVVAPSWVGDCVMAQPLFRRLHERHRGLTLDVLAPAWTATLFSRMPEVNQVIPNPFGHGELRLGARIALGRRLRQKRYGQAIVLPNSLKSAVAPLFADIALRTGFVGEARYGLLNDARPLDKARYPLMVERFALLAEKRGAALERPLPNPALSVDPAALDASFARLNLDRSRPAAAFCPGAEYGPAKRWPVAYYAQLARALAAQGRAVWLVGSTKDRPVAEQIAAGAGAGCTNLCGHTSLSDAIDVLSQADLVVTNDSGLMHVAAALDRPLVAIFGSSSPGFTPPLSPRARVVKLDLPCSPCFKRECPLGHFKCMLDLTPERVLREVAALDASAIN